MAAGSISISRVAVVVATAACLLGAVTDVYAASSSSDDEVVKTDPVDNYCVRISHQSTVQDNMLFIDGGMMSFSNYGDNGQPAGNRVIGYNDYLISVDMRSSWDWKTNITIEKHEKGKNPKTGTDTGSYIRGALFAGPNNSSQIYQFGGTTDFTNQSSSTFTWVQSDQYALWSFDTKQYATSGQYDLSTSGITRPYAGAAAEAPVLGLGFYFNGAVNNGSALQNDKLDGAQMFLPGMIVLDLNNQTAVNISTAAVSKQSRARGSMLYMQELGEMGALVMLGGGERPPNVKEDNFIGSLVPMSEIQIYDVASFINGAGSKGKTNGTWYKQTAIRDPAKGLPDPRMDFCIVGFVAQDYSSYNVYLYGGLDATQGFDELWILSLPSFTWTYIYKGKSPRFGMTCHGVAGNKMLTVSGFQSQNITATCDWEYKGVAIYDTGSEDWGSVYNSTYTPYELPPLLLSNVGGESTGGSTIKAPSGGWDDKDLEKLFTNANNGKFVGIHAAANSSNATTTASTETESSSHGGAIAGGVIGAIGGVALLVGLGLYLKKRNQKTGPQRIGYVAEKDGEIHAMEKEGSTPDPRYELDDVRAGHLRDSDGPWPAEKSGDTPPPVDPTELPTQRYSHAVELPGEHEHGHQSDDDDDVRPEPLPK